MGICFHICYTILKTFKGILNFPEKSNWAFKVSLFKNIQKIPGQIPYKFD